MLYKELDHARLMNTTHKTGVEASLVYIRILHEVMYEAIMNKIPVEYPKLFYLLVKFSELTAPKFVFKLKWENTEAKEG